MPHPRIDRANRRRQAGTAIGEDQAECLAFQSAPVKILEQRLPVGLAFALAALVTASAGTNALAASQLLHKTAQVYQDCLFPIAQGYHCILCFRGGTWDLSVHPPCKDYASRG